jgi:hypothetical protein
MTNPLPKRPQSASEPPALFNPDCKREMIIAAAAEIGGIHQKDQIVGHVLFKRVLDRSQVRIELVIDDGRPVETIRPWWQLR